MFEMIKDIYVQNGLFLNKNIGMVKFTNLIIISFILTNFNLKQKMRKFLTLINYLPLEKCIIITFISKSLSMSRKSIVVNYIIIIQTKNI